MALVTRWKTPGGPTSAAAVCGSAWASDTTTPSRASFIALATFSGVMRFVVPLDSCPNGAHLPQVLNSVRHCSYWARSAAVSGGATGAGACVAGAGCACARISTPPTRPAMARPEHTVTDARLFRMRSSLRSKSCQTGIAILAGQEPLHDTPVSDVDDTMRISPDKTSLEQQ